MAKVKFGSKADTGFKIATDETHLNSITSDTQYETTVWDVDDSNWDNIRKELVTLEVVDGAVVISAPLSSSDLTGQYPSFEDALDYRISIFSGSVKGNAQYSEEWKTKINNYIDDMDELKNNTSDQVDGKTINQILSDNGKNIICLEEIAN
jgi:hypothetical protein